VLKNSIFFKMAKIWGIENVQENCTWLSHMEWSVIPLRRWRFDCRCWRKFLQQRTDLPA
jgi:hypothetical protein